MEVTDETDPLPDPTEETRQESPPLDSPAEPEATEPVEVQNEQKGEEDSPPDSVEEKAVEKVEEPAARDKAGWEKLPKPLLPLFEALVGDLCADRNPSKAISELCHRADSIGETESLSPLLSTWFNEDTEALARAVPVSYLVAELEHGAPVLSRLFIGHWKRNGNSPKLERLADAAGNVRERLKNREAGVTLHELAIAVALYKPVRAKRLIEMAAPLLDAENDASLVREAKEWQQAGAILKKFGPHSRDFWKPRLQNPDDEWDWSSTENKNALTQISFELAKDKTGPGLFGRFLKAETITKEAEKTATPEDSPATVEEKVAPTEPEKEDQAEAEKPADEVALPPPPEPTNEPEVVEEATPPAVVEPEKAPEAKPSLSERLDAAAKGRGKSENLQITTSKEEKTVEEPVAADAPLAPTPTTSPAPTPTIEPANPPANPSPRRSSGFIIAALFCGAVISVGAYFWPQIQAKIMTPPATFVHTPTTTPVVASVPVPAAPQPSPAAVPPVPETPTVTMPSAPVAAPPPAVEPTRTMPPTESSPAMEARVNESLEIVKELPAVGRWAQRARSEPFAKVERLVTGRETYLPQLSDDYSSLIKVLLLDPPSDATTRQVVCKQAVRCIPPVQLVPLFEKLVHQDSSNQTDVKEAAKLLLQLRRESMGPSMSARLEQLISKAGN